MRDSVSPESHECAMNRVGFCTRWSWRLQVICWVLGEYGMGAGAGAGEIMDQLAAITEAQSVSDTVRGYMLTAFGKLASQSGAPLTPAAQELVHSAAASANPDLQQRALELQALVRWPLPPLRLR